MSEGDALDSTSRSPLTHVTQQEIELSTFSKDLPEEGITNPEKNINNNNNNNEEEKRKEVEEEEEEENEVKKSKLTLTYVRFYIYQTFENPEFSKLARATNIYLTSLIFFSTVTLCLQSIYSLTNTPEKENIWNILETIIVVSFTVDYIIRLLTCPNLKDFILNFLNTIDLLAILPFYIGLALEGSDLAGLGAVRVLRLIRIFRIFKIGKTSQALQLLFVSLRRSAEGIGVLFFMVCMAIVFYSSFLYFAEQTICTLDVERGLWVYTSGPKVGEPTPFQSIVATFWWAIVTMTTVGYGDHVPLSIAGKMVAAFTIVSGIMVLAFPINVIGVHFSETYQEFEAERKRKELEKMLKKSKKKKKDPKSNVPDGTESVALSIESAGGTSNAKSDATTPAMKAEKKLEFEKRLTEILQRVEALNQEVSELGKLYYADN